MDAVQEERREVEGARVESLPSARRAPTATGPARPATPGAPPRSSLDSTDGPVEAVGALALEAFTSGRQPFARTRGLEHVRVGAGLVPPGATVLRDAHGEHRRARLAVGDGWTVHALHWPRSREATVVVTAVHEQLAAQVLEQAVAGAVEAPPTGPERVVVDFWRQTRGGPRRVTRRIEAPSWAAARGNYSAPVAGALDRLAALDGGSVAGRLLLLHGPPGTGKTSLLRTLAREWRAWCRLDCVLDPEALFGDPSYLLHVALGDDGEDGEETPGSSDAEAPWRLLLLEDCDELIRREAKSSSGQHLARLLNLTDGLLGQGRRVLVAITTNEDVTALHPALVRPGRSLAHLEVGRLGRAESRAWLAAHGAPPAAAGAVGPTGATLAELFALRSGDAPVAATAPASALDRPGLYL